MSSGRQIFFNLVDKVNSLGTFNQILSKELPRYLILAGKTQWMDIRTIHTLYETVEAKNQTLNVESIDSEIWSDNEKKLFIWFIIFYNYFLEQEGLSINQESWPLISTVFFGRHIRFLHFQYLNLVKPIGKITWTSEEDSLLSEAVAATESGKWNDVSRYYFYTSNFQMFKSPKHCRERWLNHLDDKKKHGNWTPEEDLSIFKYVAENGKRWCKLVSILKETRTEHMIKNRFNSLMTKMKANKRDKEENMIQKIIRQLKKQLANIEKRKQKKQQKERMLKEQECPKPETNIKEECFAEEYFDQFNDQADKYQESHEKPSLPSHDSTVKREETEVKDYLVSEGQVNVKSEPTEENIMIPAVQVPQISQPIAPLWHLEGQMCSQWMNATQWHQRQMMPYVMPFGYYPTF